jgi:formylglycine-generating enzyme required for sulfatase activity
MRRSSWFFLTLFAACGRVDDGPLQQSNGTNVAGGHSNSAGGDSAQGGATTGQSGAPAHGGSGADAFTGEGGASSGGVSGASGADAGPSVPQGLPEVTASGHDCADEQAHDGRVCIREGWFVLSRWSTHWTQSIGGEGPFQALPTQAVYTDAYRIDDYEVTNAEYADYVHSSGAPPPPIACGYSTNNDDDLWVPKRAEALSGWTAHGPDAGRLDHPVVCVTRREAQLYCEAKGGHLPTAVEWLKAGRGPYPDLRRAPWGDTPPQLDGSTDMLDGAYWEAYAVVARWFEEGAPYPSTRPVTDTPMGMSPRGVFGLVGNASELLGTCLEGLDVDFPPGAPLVRPPAVMPMACRDRVLVAGANWRTRADFARTSFEAETLFTIANPHYEIEPVDPVFFPGDNIGRHDAPAGSPQVAPGEDSRSWLVGFRCAYDGPG